MMHLQMISRFFLLSLIFTISGYATDPTKNYELFSIWQQDPVSVIPMEVNAQSPGEEIVGIFENQVDVLSSVSHSHQKSIIVPVDKNYFITPLPGVSGDSLRMLFGHHTATTAGFDLYLYDGDSL
ncbi:MAG: hypothetical protein SCK70_12305, partial [bacterium]|nr:hypothetical protein [bacterium]